MILGVVAERIARHRGEAIGEENTKTVLIEPILRALGWDVEDLDEVRKEYRYKAGDNPVDYALFLLRTPRLYVEAKALGENLADRRWAGQIMGYAAVAGVEWAVLTDGNAYRIYNAGSSGDIDKKGGIHGSAVGVASQRGPSPSWPRLPRLVRRPPRVVPG